MSEDFYMVAIALLLPITASMLVTQVNPYHALVIRGILGAVAALVYALFGAADVALTEALVGTMLSIMLYAIAVRSSMSLRLGVIETPTQQAEDPLQLIFTALRQALQKHHLRLEVLTFPNLQALQFALENKEIHATCISSVANAAVLEVPPTTSYQINVRLPLLYEILQGSVVSPMATINFSRALRLMPVPESSSSNPLQNALEG